MKLKDDKVNEQPVEIHVTPYGQFQFRAPDEGAIFGSGETLDAARAKASAALRKGRVKVDVRFFDDEGREGTAYSRHLGSGKILARINDEVVQLDNYAPVFKPETTREELDAWLKNERQMEEGHLFRRTFKSKHGLRLGEEVDKAIEAATAEQEQAA